MNRDNRSFSLSIITLIYLAGNVFMLFNNGWYWDDWCLSSPEGFRSIMQQNGSSFIIPFMSFLMNLTDYPALIFHLFTAILEIITFIIFYKCLTLFGIKNSDNFIMTLLFALLPYNMSKITIICFWYTVGLLFFVSASYIFISFLRNKNILKRFISILLFFCSFLLLPSALVLCLAFLLFMAVYEEKKSLRFDFLYLKTIITKMIYWADFVLLPFAFWAFRMIFLKPSGVYSIGYREFSIGSLISAPVNLVLTFVQNFIGLGVVSNPLSSSVIYSVLFCILFFVIFLILILKKTHIVKINNERNILIIGVYFFLAGAFAYTMVGILPSFEGFDSRHQLLLKFGSSAIIFYLISQIQSSKIQQIILAVIISLFLVTTISRQLQFQKSWFKQMALEATLPEQKLLTDGVNFLITDNAGDYNEYDLNYAYYCYTGILNKAFKNQTRFAVDKKALIEIVNNDPNIMINNSFYHMKDCKDIMNFRYMLTINHGEILLSNPQNIKMLMMYYYNNTEFKNILKKILDLRIEPYTAIK